MRGRFLTLLLLSGALSGAGAVTVKLRPQGEELTRAVQAALAALSTPDFPVTLDSSSGPTLTLGGSAPFSPDVAARSFGSGADRRIEFNPRGPLNLQDAIRAELTQEWKLTDWTTASARARLSGADLNGDGKIDLTDLALLMNNYGKATSLGDLDGSGKVDDADLKLFSAQYKL
ncbi:hypothetical protein [Deinococcus radiotolerans]|uniref:EF-hand domain-containing protein n=1 Tax=Deinococcus radiotolerans TaxID=1309407 RepID=A0ABQ2FKK5_9DEIO|nr:hypothetical protein [Deinococcus radiotolerans]GGL07194.1 hypothetical protein GCM10010844_27490 [Deinococcus radiotolerans]